MDTKSELPLPDSNFFLGESKSRSGTVVSIYVSLTSDSLEKPGV